MTVVEVVVAAAVLEMAMMAVWWGGGSGTSGDEMGFGSKSSRGRGMRN